MPFVVDLGGFGFIEFDTTNLLTENVPDGLHDGAVFDQPGCTRGQQGGEKEVVAGRDNDDIVVFGIELLQQGNRTPTGTCDRGQHACFLSPLNPNRPSQQRTQNDQSFLGRVGLDLLNGSPLVVDTVGQFPRETQSREPSQTPGPSQEPESLLRLGGRRGSSSVGVGTAREALEGLLEAIRAHRPGRAKDVAGGLKVRQGGEAHGRGRDHVGGTDCQSSACHCRLSRGRGEERRGEVRRDGGESEAAMVLLTQLKSKKPDRAEKISQQKKKFSTERVNNV